MIWDEGWTSDEEFYLMCKAFVAKYEARQNSLVCIKQFDEKAE